MSSSSFSSLKKNRKNAADSLTKALEAATGKQNSQPTSQQDEGFWQPTADKTGTGFAIIRFLDAPDGEDLPFVRIFSHAFQGPSGSWYIENSLRTLGQPDPVNDFNTRLWNTGLDSDKTQARTQKRRTTFITNVLVIKDPGNPENEGKVFHFKCGKAIFNMIEEAITPPFDNDGNPIESDSYDSDNTDSFNPFDMWEGRPFRLKFFKKSGYRSYEKSEWGETCPIAGSDNEIEQIWLRGKSLAQWLDPKHFKTYDQLADRLRAVVGEDQDHLLSKVTGKSELARTTPQQKPKADKPREVQPDDVQVADSDSGTDDFDFDSMMEEFRQ